MALIDDIRDTLRIKTQAFDAEVQMLIDAALFDMERVGVDPALFEDTENLSPFAKTAIAAYAKAHFGYDNEEAARFDDAYRRIVCDLMNSSHNIAAMADDGESAGLGLSPVQP